MDELTTSHNLPNEEEDTYSETDFTGRSTISKDPMVCYCYRKTVKDLKEAHARLGSMQKLQEETSVGLGCGGCQVILTSLFGEETRNINAVHHTPTSGSVCSKPGTRVMKGFVIADGELESRIVSVNAVAPQLGECDATMNINYALVDHRAKPIIHRQVELKTNQTFVLDTRDEDIPRPFYGMFLYGLGRSNYGSARFNVYWYTPKCVTSTHENNDPGRPRTFLPLLVNREFIEGDTNVFLAMMNPHQVRTPIEITIFDVESDRKIQWQSYLDPMNSTWIDANQFLYSPALQKFGAGRFGLKIESGELDFRKAIVTYIFFYNKRHKLWTSNHL